MVTANHPPMVVGECQRLEEPKDLHTLSPSTRIYTAYKEKALLTGVSFQIPTRNLS